MNEDYLWDKTGSDVEIEKLENSLKSLRYIETAVPVMPVKPTVEKRKSFGFFPFAIPVMACLGFLFLTLGFWFSAFNKPANEIAVNEIQTQIEFQQNDDTIILSPFNSNPDNKKTKQIEEKPWVRRKSGKVRKPRPAYVRVNTVTAQKKGKINPTDELTKEEKYAYDQLMAALAVTSSQFKLVKDKIQSIENQNAVGNSGQ